MFKLIFGKRALRELNKLDRNIKERIWNKLQNCKGDPFRYLEPLVEIEGFKLRVGEYRVIINVDNEIKILNVEKVGHRRNVYDR